ncbi:acyl-CoA dehydrogenase family protein [Nocardia sp. CA-119907]|uniref:acyl-CoA dehydrogenase family protein n=1 Tax=Nocardia sp. CA-119907 TaxID=3239973 RepID=UPI003D9813E3
MTTHATHRGKSYWRSAHSSPAKRPTSIALGQCIAGDGQKMRAWVSALLQTLDDRPVPGRTHSDEIRHGYELLGELVAGLGGSSRAIAQDFGLLCAIYDGAAVFAPRLLPVLSHFNLGIETIETRGTGEPYQLSCLEELDDVRAVGGLAATELGYGTNLLGLGVIAVWQPDVRKFTLHTPSAEAINMWPNVGLAGVAKTFVLLARLIVDGRDEGVWPFVVRLRTRDTVSDGVDIEPLPPTTLGPPMDHAAFCFDGMSIPEGALLSGHSAGFDENGEFSCDLSHYERFHLSSGALGSGRVLFAGAALASARAGWAITCRYANQRPTSGGVLLADRDGTQQSLVSCAASLFALTALTNLARARHDAQHPCAATLDMLIKPAASDTARAVLEACVEICGAQGISSANLIGDYFLRGNGIAIAEGANGALKAAVGRALSRMDTSGLYLQPRSEQLPWWHAMLHEREQTITAEARARARTAATTARPDTAATKVYVATMERMAADALSSRATAVEIPEAIATLDDLVAVYCLERIKADANWFAMRGKYSQERAVEVEDALSTRYSLLAEHLSDLLEAVDIPRLPAAIDADSYVIGWLDILNWRHKFPDTK